MTVDPLYEHLRHAKLFHLTESIHFTADEFALFRLAAGDTAPSEHHHGTHEWCRKTLIGAAKHKAKKRGEPVALPRVDRCPENCPCRIRESKGRKT